MRLRLALGMVILGALVALVGLAIIWWPLALVVGGILIASIGAVFVNVTPPPPPQRDEPL